MADETQNSHDHLADQPLNLHSERLKDPGKGKLNEEVLHRSLIQFRLTHAGNCEALAFLHGEFLRWDRRRGRWLLWNGNFWEKDNEDVVKRCVVDVARKRFIASLDLELNQQREVHAWARSSEMHSNVLATLAMAPAFEPFYFGNGDWDRDPFLLAVQNGVVDLRMGEIRQGRKEDYITQSSGIPFVKNAKAPRWELFLKEIFDGDEGLISFVKRAAGYSLTGLPVEEIVLICWGNGRNGKTVLLNTLRKLLGDYADNTPFSTFEIDPKGRSQNTNDLAKLVGKRLVTSSETSGSVRLNEERVKALTGRDPVTCRFLFQEFFTYTPAYKIWLAVNHKPIIIGVDDGIWSRVRLIPFAVSFKGREDKYLEETLEKELPGILQWAISGCLEWQEKGLPQPDLLQKATDEYRSESDIVGRFLKEKTEEKKESKIQASVLYEAFKQWVKETGETLITSNAFGRRVTDHGVKREEGRCNYYVDIAIL